jgi:hypothetical protein
MTHPHAGPHHRANERQARHQARATRDGCLARAVRALSAFARGARSIRPGVYEAQPSLRLAALEAADQADAILAEEP